MIWKELIDLLKSSESEYDINSKRKEIAEWLPCVVRMFEYNQENSYHQYDLWLHSVHTVLEIPESATDDMLYLAALLHDIGKPDCKRSGKNENDTNAHYYGHPEKSEQIIRDEVVPELISKGVILSEGDIKRLIYYVRFHDDRVPLTEETFSRHLSLVSIVVFKNLIMLQIADAKAHNQFPLVEERIKVCSDWLQKLNT